MRNYHSQINFNLYIVHYTPFHQLTAFVTFFYSLLLTERFKPSSPSSPKTKKRRKEGRKGGREGEREEREKEGKKRKKERKEGRKKEKKKEKKKEVIYYLPWKKISCKKARKICLGAQQGRCMHGSTFMSSFMCEKAFWPWREGSLSILFFIYYRWVLNKLQI